MQRILRALTIAGSDSGGCAGIQADLKTFGALGVHGMSVITSVTAQDTSRVYDTADLPLENIELQIKAVMEDIGADAVKTGMLSSAAIIGLVESKVRQYHVERLVVDPVMVSTGGDRLIREDAIDLLKNCLFPRALVVTPNLQEAEVLVGARIANQSELREAALAIHRLGPQAVVIKGGHFESENESLDLFYDGHQFLEFRASRVPTRNTHGSGCTFASAIAAFLAKGLELEEAVGRAKEYVTEAIRHSFPLGQGNGPLGHFYRFW
ncbi:MAG: bifunctional hydroxymethylpyrimidine kinase/phosphomethylpyrimidine kinase [Acidobacteria bacterium]|nr:MAG: bifunctional hydroxymethylpyrimidine kinase/phosphomethylpyrimidine kinase [Acidobacteriota bacterium]